MQFASVDERLENNSILSVDNSRNIPCSFCTTIGDVMIVIDNSYGEYLPTPICFKCLCRFLVLKGVIENDTI